MIFKGVLAGALVATATGPLVAAAPNPEVLQRKGDWVADYGREGCHVYGQFGSGDGEVIARFSRYDLGDSFKFALFGKRVVVHRVAEAVHVDFGLAGKPVIEQALSGTAANRPGLFFAGVRLDGWKRPVVTKVNWKPEGIDPGPRITAAQEASVTGLTVAIPGKPAFRLEAGSLDKPFIVLRDCMDKLVRRWGYDPDVQKRLARPIGASNYPAEWLTDADFPAGALRNRMNAMVHFRLDADAQGKIVGCQILDRTEPKEFGGTTCTKISRRAKLEPALDADLKPVPSFVVHTFNWRTG